MTKSRNLKRRIRVRMSETGESYSTARRRVLELAGEQPATSTRVRWLRGASLVLAGAALTAFAFLVLGSRSGGSGSSTLRFADGEPIPAANLVFSRDPVVDCLSRYPGAIGCLRVSFTSADPTAVERHHLPKITMGAECGAGIVDATRSPWCAPRGLARLASVACGGFEWRDWERLLIRHWHHDGGKAATVLPMHRGSLLGDRCAPNQHQVMIAAGLDDLVSSAQPLFARRLPRGGLSAAQMRVVLARPTARLQAARPFFRAPDGG